TLCFLMRFHGAIFAFFGAERNRVDSRFRQRSQDLFTAAFCQMVGKKSAVPNDYTHCHFLFVSRLFVCHGPIAVSFSVRLPNRFNLRMFCYATTPKLCCVPVERRRSTQCQAQSKAHPTRPAHGDERARHSARSEPPNPRTIASSHSPKPIFRTQET